MFGWGSKGASPEQAADPELAILPDGESVVMIYALDMPASEFAPSVAHLAARMRGAKLVVVHSSFDFQPMMAQKQAFEVLPDLAQMQRFPRLMNWPQYMADRRDLLLAKWRPDRAVAFGMTMDDYVAKTAEMFAAEVATLSAGPESRPEEMPTAGQSLGQRADNA